MSYQIRRLNFGAVTIDAAMKVRGIPPGTRVDVPAQGYLIMGDTGPILVDAGYRDPSVLGLGGRVGPGQGFHEQLAAHGVRAGDLACVIMTHLHRDHAGHLDKVPMHVPVVVNRSEMASACSGVQGTAYARDDIHHLLDRVYTPGALRFLDLEYSGPIELAGGITCQLTGGHTPGSISIIVPTGYGQACLCGSSAARSCRWRAGADQQLHHRGTAGDRCRQTRLAVPLPAACPRRAGRSRSRPAGRPDRW